MAKNIAKPLESLDELDLVESESSLVNEDLIEKKLEVKTEEKPVSTVKAFVEEVIVLRAVHPFPLPYNGAIIEFKKDQIIDDPILVRFLLENKCPVKRVEEKIDFQTCPKCFHSF